MRLIPDHEDFGDRAPITEALIDIRVVPRGDLRLPQLLTVRGMDDALGFGEPQVQEKVEVHLRGGDEPGFTHQQAMRGYLLRSSDQLHALQLQRDGFTFSRLRPYETWANLKASADPYWRRYLDVARPERVTRVAVRYINQFDLPGDAIALGDWFNTYPQLAYGKLSLPLQNFLMRLEVKHPDSDELAIVTFASRGPPRDGAATLLLDIDVAKQVDLAPDDPTIWQQHLESLQEFRNDVFFGSITQKLKERLNA
jgi:uncharacterized protein (TIGR04255 family)